MPIISIQSAPIAGGAAIKAIQNAKRKSSKPTKKKGGKK